MVPKQLAKLGRQLVMRLERLLPKLIDAQGRKGGGLGLGDFLRRGRHGSRRLVVMMVLLFFLVEARRPLIWFCIFLERGAPLGGGQADNQGGGKQRRLIRGSNWRGLA